MFYERKEKGAEAESQVREHYLQNGYALKLQNWRCPEAEIDLIVESESALRFVEVRYRQDANLEMAFPESKKTQFKKAVMMYLQEAGKPRKAIHLDLTLVSPRGIERFEDYLAEL
jgi:Holliday junction resolvase-like predicted endonuclease